MKKQQKLLFFKTLHFKCTIMFRSLLLIYIFSTISTKTVNYLMNIIHNTKRCAAFKFPKRFNVNHA